MTTATTCVFLIGLACGAIIQTCLNVADCRRRRERT